MIKKTIDYYQKEPENKYLDRKEADIKPQKLANLISAFANADGGTMVIGIDDSGIIKGINSYGEEKINSLINAARNHCKPMPVFEYDFLNVLNCNDEPDRILLINISGASDQIIRTENDRTYLRIGDSSRELLGDDLRNLEYAKNTRHFEDEVNYDAVIDDLDFELLSEYRKRIGADEISFEQVLRARGFIKNISGKDFLTNAAVLLFSKNIQRFYPNCRIRFIRYEGVYQQVGKAINISRDYSIEFPILRIIEEAQKFISTQLREFTLLNGQTGRFVIVPEYPEFAWLEGIVNAVAHREYALAGSFIKVSMYDDRLEIESPGKFPSIVTAENITYTRYSRNPRISRVLTEFGWVRELNEGVKRIYEDMALFFLDQPEYIEQEHSVTLKLKNNYVMRKLRQEDRTLEYTGIALWNNLDAQEKRILEFIVGRGTATRAELVSYTNSSSGTVNSRLHHLIELNLIVPLGKTNDPKRTYKTVF